MKFNTSLLHGAFRGEPQPGADEAAADESAEAEDIFLYEEQ